MSTNTETTTRRIYVACLGSYNEGRLHGAWIDASSDADEMSEQVQTMLSQSRLDFGRKAEEYAIHDYEGYPRDVIGEYSGLQYVATLEASLEELESESVDAAAFFAWLGNDSTHEPDDLDGFRDSYSGQWDSGAAYAEEYFVDSGQVPDESPVHSYIDWERVWTGEFDGYWITDEGHVFIPQ